MINSARFSSFTKKFSTLFKDSSTLAVAVVLFLNSLLVIFPLRGITSAATQANGEIFYKRSVDGGATFGDYYNISNDAGPSEISHVAANNGVVHVLWDGNEQPREALYRRSPDSGLSFESTVNVSSNNGDSSESDLAAEGNTLHTIWEEDYLDANGNPDPCCSGDEAFYRRSATAGATFDNSFDLSNTPSAHSRDPKVAASGSLVGAVYEDPTPGGDNIFFNRSTDDGQTWSPYVNVSNGGGAEPSIAISGQNVHAIWESGYNRSTNGGQSFVGASGLPSGFGTAPQVAAYGNNVHIIGCSGSGGSLNYRTSSDNGQTWQSSITVASSGCKKPTIAVNGSNVYITWENKATASEIYFRKSTNGGASFDPVINISSNEGNSGEPSVAVDPTTGYVYIVWYDDTFPTPPAVPTFSGPQPPIANAGPDQNLSDSDGNSLASVTLDGIGSSDPGGSIVSYEWKQGTDVVGTTATVNLDLPLGSYVFTLTVTDNDSLTDSDEVTVNVGPNQAPVANAGQDQVVIDNDSSGAENVALDGSLSSDDGSIVAWEWNEAGNVLGTTPTLATSFALGSHTVTLTVTDNLGVFSTDTAVVTVNPKPPVVAYVSPNTDGTINGVPTANEDILAFDGASYTMYFDGSDVGVAGLSLGAFDIQTDGSILMSFTDPGTIPGIAGTVDDSDIVKFTPTSTGPNTAGTFSLHFDGSDVGLTQNAEEIDALSVLSDGRILLSTTGSASVTGVAAEDEDIMAFTSTSLGANTAGTYAVYFDGSDVGLANNSSEDVDGLAINGSGALYLSTLGAFSVTGVAGQGEDVFVFTPASLGSTTAGTFSSTLFFDGSVFGFGSIKVSSIDLP